MGNEANSWSVYLVRTRDGHLYTGVATDVERRFEEHSSSGARGAKYLRGRGPLELVYRCEIGARGLAQQVESQIKSLARIEKDSIVHGGLGREQLLARLADDPPPASKGRP